VAAGRTDRQVQEFIGADWLVYQDLDDLVRAVLYDKGGIVEFDTSCFSGHYVTGDVTPEYLARLERERVDGARMRGEGRRRSAPVEASPAVRPVSTGPRAGAA
jgi:amidophosphoribosyltransferase